jgi:uncharacterized delta-60 repeat protein
MNVIPISKWTATLLLACALGACEGGGGDSDAGAGGPPAGTVVGPAGGTVLGPNSSKVVIPPGALTTDTTINIEQSSAGAPALPSGFVASGAMFAFTPHGTTFAVPVTLTLPFDPTTVPAGKAPAFFKTNAQSQWEQIGNAIFGATSLTAQITSFSNGQVGIVPINNPLREWSFKLFSGDGQGPFTQPPPDGSGTQEIGVLDQTFRFGKAFLDLPFVTKGFTHAPDRNADGLIQSSADGVTFGVFAEAPNGRPGGRDPIGSVSELRQSQSFRRIADAASIGFTITNVTIATTDFTTAKVQLNRVDPNFLITGEVFFEVRAYRTSSPDSEFFRKAGRASVSGNNGVWTPQAIPDGSTASSLWSMANFDFSTTPLVELPDGSINGCKGTGAALKLKEPLSYRIDIPSSIGSDDFTFEITTFAQAVNHKGSGGLSFDCLISSANAFLRDPLDIGTPALTLEGVEPTNRPLAPPPSAVVAPTACVPGSGPAGVLQFDAPTFEIGEYAGMVPTITVSRTGGSSGAVTATFTTTDGTAIAGKDYTPVSASIFFADGEAGQRVLTVPTIQNLVVAPDKTVNLTLSQPGGCATLGAQATAQLIIRDDGGAALPPPPAFTIGGTVTGLVGTGLVLQDLKFVPLAISTDGPFTLPLPTNSGSPYAVSIVSQPTNPLQVCTVTNGSGTVGNANITNVAVNCVTPPPNGSLDASFGPGGKVTTSSTGAANAVALQGDGKIVSAGGTFTLTRHNADGTLDQNFGNKGKVSTDFGGGAGAAFDVAIQSDNKIVVAGSTRARAGFADDDDFAVRRYLQDGSLDPAFGTGGSISTDFAALGDIASAVAIQTDRKIVVAGNARSASGTDLAVARYNTDGSLDQTFGSGGKVTTDVAGGVDLGVAMQLQPDGKIVVLGRVSLAGSVVVDTPALVRYNSDGSLDASFGANGKVLGAGNGPASALALQADGKILIAGSVNAGSSSSAFGLTRFLANGSVDTAFGTPTTTFFNTGNGTIGRTVAVQPDGKIVLAGQAASGNSTTFDVAVARYETNGNLDTAFATGGKLLVDFFAGTDAGADVVIQPDGKIVIAGSARNGSFTEFALMRVNQ